MKIFLPILFFIAEAAFAGGSISTAVKKSGGSIYDLITGKNLFTIEAEIRPLKEGLLLFSSRYFDLNQKEVMTEEAYFRQASLQKYTVRQSQLNEVYELNVAGKKIVFTIQKGGETKAKTRETPENLLIGPAFVPFMQKHWSDLQNQRKVVANLAVMDYMDTFGFEFEKIPSANEKNGITVRMRPTNALISVMVNPIYFLVQNDGARILELKGPMLVKLKVGNGWEDFDGRAVFAY